MYRLFLCFCIIGCCRSAHAQSARFDLSKNPGGAPAPEDKSNAAMLRSAAHTKPDSALLKPKGMNEGTYIGKGMNNDKMLNMQSTQYKIGNTKATSTIYYDEAGKVKGTNTTIGGK